MSPRLLLFALASAPAWALAAPETVRGAGDVGAGRYLQMLLGLLAVLAVIAALAWGARRVGRLQGGVGGELRVLGGLSLGSRERVVLVQAGETQLLLGVAPGRVQTLHVLEEPLVPAVAQQEAGGGFAERLAAALKREDKS